MRVILLPDSLIGVEMLPSKSADRMHCLERTSVIAEATGGATANMTRKTKFVSCKNGLVARTYWEAGTYLWIAEVLQ